MPEENKTDDQNIENEDNQDDNQGEGQQGQNQDENKGKSLDDKKAEEDKKEEARKAFEMRQAKKSSASVSREEFEALKSDTFSIREENATLKFRNAHPEITDDEFNSIKAHAKGSGKSNEETLNDPVFKTYFENKDTKDRINGATPAPSTQTKSSGGKPDWANMAPEEFQAKQDEVLRRSKS